MRKRVPSEPKRIKALKTPSTRHDIFPDWVMKRRRLLLPPFFSPPRSHEHTGDSTLPRLPETKNMWDHTMSVTHNASGMCCEEIEEFVMGGGEGEPNARQEIERLFDMPSQ